MSENEQSKLTDLMKGEDRIVIKVHDHGHVALIDVMPRLVPEGRFADYRVVQAARVSYGKGLGTSVADRGLLRYLLRHHHTSPFEMVKFTFHLKMPIFVARQWIRHRTANVNEYSGRYSQMPDEFYIPEQIRFQSSDNMQGSQVVDNPDYVSHDFNETIKLNQDVYHAYERMITNEHIARELARIVLPLNNYTEMYWTMDLSNLLKFLQLRMDSHSQLEIRDYATAIYKLIAPLVPDTVEAFRDFSQESLTLTRMEVNAISDGSLVVTGSKREKEEFKKKLEQLKIFSTGGNLFYREDSIV